MQEAKEEKELRFPITAADFRPVGEKLIADPAAYANEAGWAVAPDNREGIRISFPAGAGDGWFLLRMSVHDPILPLNLESNAEGGVRILAEKLLGFLRQADTAAVDYTSLEEFFERMSLNKIKGTMGMPDAKPRDRQRARLRLGTHLCGLRPLPEYLSAGIFPPPARRGPVRRRTARVSTSTRAPALRFPKRRPLILSAHKKLPAKTAPKAFSVLHYTAITILRRR